MKAISTATLSIALILAGSSAALAARDFSALTNEELALSRGSLNNESAETREAFRNEWKKRISTMSAEDRARFEKLAGIDRSKSSEENENSGCSN